MHQPQALQAAHTTEVYYEDHQHPRRWHYVEIAATTSVFGLVLFSIGIGQASTSIGAAVPLVSGGLVLIAVSGVIVVNELRGQMMRGVRVDSQGIHYTSHAGLLKSHIPADAVLGLDSVPAKLRDHQVQVKVTGHTHQVTPRSTEAFRTAVDTMRVIHERSMARSLPSRMDAETFYSEARASRLGWQVIARIMGLVVPPLVLIWLAVVFASSRLIEPGQGAWQAVLAIALALVLITVGAIWTTTRTQALDYEELLVSDAGITLINMSGTLVQSIDPARITDATTVHLLGGQPATLIRFENGRTLRVHSANPDTLAAAIEVARREYREI